MEHRAWRERGRLHIACGHCSSTGATHAETRLLLTPEAQRQLDDHVVAMQRLHNEQEAGYRTVTDAFRAKQIDEATLGQRLTDLIRDYTGKTAAEMLRAPGPRAGTTEVLDACPWCGAPLGGIEVAGIRAGSSPPTTDHAPQAGAT
jgi:hypothetical protein